VDWWFLAQMETVKEWWMMRVKIVKMMNMNVKCGENEREGISNSNLKFSLQEVGCFSKLRLISLSRGGGNR